MVLGDVAQSRWPSTARPRRPSISPTLEAETSIRAGLQPAPGSQSCACCVPVNCPPIKGLSPRPVVSLPKSRRKFLWRPLKVWPIVHAPQDAGHYDTGGPRQGLTACWTCEVKTQNGGSVVLRRGAAAWRAQEVLCRSLGLATGKEILSSTQGPCDDPPNTPALTIPTLVASTNLDNCSRIPLARPRIDVLLGLATELLASLQRDRCYSFCHNVRISHLQTRWVSEAAHNFQQHYRLGSRGKGSV